MSVSPRRSAEAALLLVLASVLLLSVAPERAHAKESVLLVTVAARECGDYQDIRANLARNNIMESLQDLGADTLYQSGQQVDPRTELKGQPKCRPITGWRFTAGSGIQGHAVSGPWGSLSIVTGADNESIVTEASTPLLGYQGEPIPGRSIKGATTIELGQAGAERAAHNSLWLQGGTPIDPMLYGDPQFTGKYGFGALRCATDDLNGDNVETIQFASGVRQVCCYAYYVTPPPSSGTIVLRKETQGASASETFNFGGNVSYNVGGAFDLKASDGNPRSIEFFRAETRPGDLPWSAIEDVPSGWKLTEINCTANGSPVAKSVPDAKVEITLVAGDTVTCTYVDKLTPPAGAVLIRKTSEGGTGTFGYKILNSSGDAVAQTNVTTKRDGIAANSRPLKLDPGQYSIVEESPSNPKGEWQRADASCNASHTSKSGSVSFTVTAGQGAVCAFTNRLVYPGKLTIEKETINGRGSAAFTVSPLADRTVQRRQFATVKKGRVPVVAHGQSTSGLPYGVYVIQESAGRGQSVEGWSLIAVACNGGMVSFEQGRVRVRISPDAPHVVCKFVNLFAPHRAKVAPGMVPPEPGGEKPDVSVEKELVGKTEGPAPVLSFRMTVRNNAKVAASNVSVIDSPGAGMRIKSVSPGQGSCLQLEELVCTLGTIKGGDQTSVIVQTESSNGGPATNEAVVGSGSPDASTSNSHDSVHVVAPAPGPRPGPGSRNAPGHHGRHHGACSSAAGSAHISC